MLGKNAEIGYTKSGMNGYKLPLILCAASAAVVDAVIIVMLAVGGAAAEFLVCPCILFALDVIYLVVGAFFTSFRFRYSLGVWISYVLLFTIVFCISNAVIFGGNGTVLTNAALCAWAVVHVVNILCAVIMALYASRVFRNRWIAFVLAGLFLAGCAAYAAFTCTRGYFGQGAGNRPLVFRYNRDSGEYEVVEVLSGRSDSINVPETFNGKPVTALSYGVLTDPTVKNYTISGDVKLIQPEYLTTSYDMSGKTLNVDKQTANAIRSELFEQASARQRAKTAVALANAVVPCGLEDGEGYVTFAYDEIAYGAVDGAVLPIYIGDLDEFDFAAYASPAQYNYLAHTDLGSVEDLYWAYHQSGYILSDIACGGNSLLEDGKVTSDTVAKVTFERVIEVDVEDGNDTKYRLSEKQPAFCSDYLGGSRLGCRYIAESRTQGFTDGCAGRKGFYLRWYYSVNGEYVDYKDLSEVVANTTGNQVGVTPEWHLMAPMVTASTSAQDNKTTYGDGAVTLQGSATIEAEGVQLAYVWAQGSEVLAQTANYTIEKPAPWDSGEYKLLVAVDGGEVTSLSADSSDTVTLKVAEKPASFTWDIPQDAVYDGNPKTVSVTLPASELVYGDELTYTLKGASSHSIQFTDAGSYTCSVNVWMDAKAALYDFGDSLTKTFTIAKRQVEVEWSGYEGLVYNGSKQMPTPTATGVDGDDIISQVTGAQRNAGDHVALAYTDNTNYTLSGSRRTFSIAKAPLSVWPQDNTVVYGNQPEHQRYITYGFLGGDDNTALSGTPRYTYSVNPGDSEYVVGTFTDGISMSGLTSVNYDISYGTGDLTVTPRTAKLAWGNYQNLVYNAREKNVTATVSNLVQGDDIAVTVSGGNGKDAGSYTATATALTGARASNYVLPQAVALAYTIDKRDVTVNWQISGFGYVYDGTEKGVYGGCTGLTAEDKDYATVTGNVATDAGSYTAEFSLGEVEKNYNIINATCNWTIEKAESEITVTRGGQQVSGDWQQPVSAGETIAWSAGGVPVTARATFNGSALGLDGNSYTFGQAGKYVFTFTAEDGNHKQKRVTVTVTVESSEGAV